MSEYNQYNWFVFFDYLVQHLKAFIDFSKSEVILTASR